MVKSLTQHEHDETFIDAKFHRQPKRMAVI